ncbi:MAG: RsmE family RNA methyltransferase [Verrucomicrobiota bacterium]|jgi:16S rRNA (uracil1498-N3)-methyltransferase
MHRFHLPPEQCQSEVLTLTGGQAHHAADVLRVRKSEEAAVLDGAGREFLCSVQAVERGRILLKVEQIRVSPVPACRITLAQAIPKGKMFESILQKATELGVWRVVPLLSERVATRLEGETRARKAEKWRQTAVEAIKQCGQRWLPRVEAPATPEAWLAAGEKFDLTLIGSLHGEARHPREYFLAFEREHVRRPASVCVWIGPEGDFSAGEVEGARRGGALPITMGPLILRSETAALYALSVVNYELQAPGSV